MPWNPFRRRSAPPEPPRAEPEPMVAVPIPMLLAILMATESKKGAPLTEQEVLEIRDNFTCIAMTAPDAARFNEGRGDIDPDHAWEGWLAFKASGEQ